MAYTFRHGDRPLEGITVQRAIGRGGFGEVYYALADSGKQLALKYLRENPEIELRGIAHVMNLKSPHLITIYDVKQNAAGESFVIMEYVSGPSLRELLLAEPGGLGVQKAAYFLKGIAAGLSYLHERGIVHRDLKPANIFYDDAYVKIGDYGLSKHMSVSKHSGQTVSVGTVHYMAPEIGSGSYTKAIDIYALGVILYEMLTGRLPFSGASMAEVLMRHLRDNPDLTGIPRPFVAVIAKALAKDPADRYADVQEMVEAVMESADISRSVDAFDATALTQVPRAPGAADAELTVTSPRHLPPIPVLDAREIGAGAALPPRLQRKLEHLNKKLQQRAARLERHLGPRRDRPPTPQRPAAVPGANRRAQVFILLLVTAALAAVLGVLHTGRPSHGLPHAIPLAIFMIGGTIGPLLGHLRFVGRAIARHPLLDRLVYASLAGFIMLPGYAVATEEVGDRALARIILAPLAALVICDWGRRIEAGRRGDVCARSAFWPAVVGFVTAAIVDADAYMWSAAGVCAAMSLLTQAAASMWPRARVAGSAPPTPDVAACCEPSPAEAPEARASEGSDAVAPPAAANGSPPATTGMSPPVQLADHAAEPSFVGRTANAGIAFLGKILLLCGVALALGQGPFQDYAVLAMKDGSLVVDREFRPIIEHGIPAGVVILAMVAGCLLLLVARRREGTWHFVRGCLGSLAVFIGAMLGMIEGREGFRILFGRADVSALMSQGDGTWGPVVATAVLLGLGALIFLWPPKSQRQKPIVI